MQQITIIPRKGEYGIDPGPFPLYDPNIAFQYFWWWFNQGEPFISIYDRLPEENRFVEAIIVDLGNRLPGNVHLYHTRRMFIHWTDHDRDFKTDPPKPIRGVTHWRYE